MAPSTAERTRRGVGLAGLTNKLGASSASVIFVIQPEENGAPVGEDQYEHHDDIDRTRQELPQDETRVKWQTSFREQGAPDDGQGREAGEDHPLGRKAGEDVDSKGPLVH